MSGNREPVVTLQEEQLEVDSLARETGTVRARKHVDEVPFEQVVQRGTEHADLERRPPQEGDSGEVETLPDGSLSIPVFEEQVVVEKRLVVRERVIVRKHTVYDEHVVRADLRREHLEVTADEGVEVHER